MTKKSNLLIGILIFQFIPFAFGQSVDSLELLDASDADVLIGEESSSGELDLSKFEEVDDLESLKKDVGEDIFEEDNDGAPVQKKVEKKKSDAFDDIEKMVNGEKAGKVINDADQLAEKESGRKEITIKDGTEIFDTGEAERELLEVSKFIEGKIPEKEWDEIATSAQVDKYVVQEGDWLWKISQKLFGSGFYYSKIWSMNPQITNPHEIEPGMSLVFTTGDSDAMPDVRIGSYDGPVDNDSKNAGKLLKQIDFAKFGDKVIPPWMLEREKLKRDGVYFQFASEETLDDIKKISDQNLNSEFKKYEPPVPEIVIKEPGEQYDRTGFDRNSKISFNVKEGFFLNTFVTSNIVQDLGEIIGMGKENVFIQKFDNIYVKFDDSVKVKPGDEYSVYIAGGEIEHQVSDRVGYKYTIGAQIKALRKINEKWECLVTDQTGTIQRGDRITVFTPKIGKIIKTFNKRNIEAAIVNSFMSSAGGLSFGDVAYLDRGRADGVEMGTVFEFYSFYDKGTEKRLTADPTYKIGEASVISLTDNFATVLISLSSEAIPIGTIALTKTEEQAALAESLRNKDILGKVRKLEEKALDELDVELNLDDLNEDLLDKADQIQLTEDELEELERQEREKSVIKDHEKDLQELERLEQEISEAESSLKEAQLDEDKFLEQQNLNDVEKDLKGQNNDGLESANDIEEEVGLKFMDEDLNSKENPYGLTEFDLEEIDELLNTDEL
jgi:hypothetical protein